MMNLSEPKAILLLTAVAATGGLRILFIFTSFSRCPSFKIQQRLFLFTFQQFYAQSAPRWRHNHPFLLASLGDQVFILNLYFVFLPQVIALSVFLLKERCGVFRFLAALVLVIGVVLIAKPPMIFGQNKEVVRTWTSHVQPQLVQAEYDVLGYSLVFLATTMSAIGIVLTKLLANKVSNLQIFD